MSAKFVTFVRHAESSSFGFYDGKKTYLDPPLTLAGQDEASQLSLVADYVIISPLQRARETFALSAVISEERAPTIDFLFREYRDRLEDFLHGEPILRETRSNLSERARLAIEYLKRLPFGHVCVITHRQFLEELMRFASTRQSPFKYAESRTFRWIDSSNDIKALSSDHLFIRVF